MQVKWVLFCSLAEKYYEHYGDLNVPKDFMTNNGVDASSDGFMLGRCVHQLRDSYKRGKLKPNQIEILENLGMVWSFEKAFDKHYELAKKYYEHYGDLLVPGDFKTSDGVTYDPNGFALGGWISSQRCAFRGTNASIMDDERINKLLTIGMVFDIPTIDDKWMEKYELLKKYYEYYGDSNVPQNFITSNGIDYDECGVLLGYWLMNQRLAYKGIGSWSLSMDRIKLLEDVKVQWIRYGRDGVIEKELITEKNKIKKQKELLCRAYSVLSTFDWETLPSKREINKEFIRRLKVDENDMAKRMEIDENWKMYYDLAKNYYNHYKNLRVSQSFKTKNGVDYDEDGLYLGRWIEYQRIAYKGTSNLIMTDKKIKLLESIGMDWFPRINTNEKYVVEIIRPANKKRKEREILSRTYTILNKFDGASIPSRDELNETFIESLSNYKKADSDDLWFSNYTILRKFYEKRGHLNIPVEFKTKDGINYDEDGLDLCAWLNNQINRYNNGYAGKFSDKQIKLLEEIGVVWSKLDLVWEGYYKLAKKYYKYHGNLKIPQEFKTKNGFKENKNGTYLGKWVNKQRILFAEGKLTPKRIDLLKKIGMIWDVRDYSWKQNYELCKKYYEYYGNSNIHREFKTEDGINYSEDGLAIGMWLMYQRRKYNGMDYIDLTEEQIKLLNDIEMDWEGKRKTNWDSHYLLARNYYNHYGNLLIPQMFRTMDGINYNENGIKLGTWLWLQRSSYRGGRGDLTAEKIKLLEDLQIKWFSKDEHDFKFQEEIINNINLLKKKKEILNRTYSLLNRFKGESLPSKEEINEEYIKMLEKK